ncbi:ABC-type transport auxiliary lipoprotein family protein [Dokdonella sp.]|uniref:ABC-type transport auxiliary lipoprotein family protein n=1 Tax=Dokdonella sp. TaxID=2291710 RepID=UPI002F3E5073
MRTSTTILPALLLAALALTGCGAPTVPDFTYFRLPRAQPLEVASAPLFDEPIVVDAFGADGLYADQSLIYALDPGAQQLRQYHYQLWTDPPTRILQRRLIAQLRASKIAAQVTDELPASNAAIRVSGIILRFDRVPTANGGWSAVVALKLRADGRDGRPIVDDYYRADEAAAGNDIKSTVDAYGAALDRIYAQFHADLRQRGGSRHG